MNNSFVELPLDIVLQSERGPLDKPNLANFSDVTVSTDYETQTYISSYLLQSVFQVIYLEGLIKYTTGNLNSVEQIALFTTVGILKMEKAGYTTSDPCRFEVTMGDEMMPNIDISPNGIQLDAILHLQLQC